MSLGLRYETQTNIHDWRDFAPRIGLAWAPGGSANSRPKTVLRAGFGIFYDRFALANTITSLLYNGVVQQQYIIMNPDFYPSVPSVAQLGISPSGSSVWEVSSRLRAPYLLQSAVAIERQLPANTTVVPLRMPIHMAFTCFALMISMLPCRGALTPGRQTAVFFRYIGQGRFS